MTENNDKSGNSAFPTLIAPSVDPLRNVQSSENYINSLEQKLKRIKGGAKEPSSREIIQSLEKAKADQMAHLMQGSTSCMDKEYRGSVVSKSHGGKEQSLEEIVALVHQDELGQTHRQTQQNAENKTRTDDSGAVK